MSGYLGSESSKASQHDLKLYKGKDVKDCVRIRNDWYWLEENCGEARLLLGQYLVRRLGWGNSFVDWDDFNSEEKELLKTTFKVGKQ